jgi:hypothetical protein
MKRAILIATAALALAAPASPALAAPGFTLNLTGPATGVVGQPLVFQVSGTDAFDPASPLVSFRYSVAVIPTRVVATCPANRNDAIQLGYGTGDVPVLAGEERIDWNGSFSQTFSFIARQPGALLVCAYTIDLSGWTFVMANKVVDITAGAPAAAPKATKRPRVTRAGRRLVCNPGRWSNATGGFAYRWSVNGKAKKSAAGRKLRITRGLRGRRVACSVTAKGAAGSTTAVSRAVRV